MPLLRMKMVSLQDHGLLRQRDLAYVGKSLSWIEKLKLRGVGSPKFIYDVGVEEFDGIKKLSNALDYVSMELFQKGLIIRFKKKDTFKACLIRYEELRAINVVSQRFKVRLRGKTHIVYQATVDFQSDRERVSLKLHPSNYTDGIRFLAKKPLQNYFNFTLLPEIKEMSDENTWIFTLLDGMV